MSWKRSQEQKLRDRREVRRRPVRADRTLVVFEREDRRIDINREIATRTIREEVA